MKFRRQIQFSFLALVFCQAAQAVPKNPAASDNFAGQLTSLNYYPHAGRTEANAHIATTLANSSTVDTGANSKTNYTQFYGAMVFGLGRGLRFGLNETLLWDQTIDSTSVAGAETTNTSQGLSNPTFVAAWRYLEDSRSRLSGDLTLNFAPSFGTKIAGDGADGKAGNNLTGGWVVTLETEFFWRLKRNQVELAPSITKNYTVQSEGAGGVTSTTDAYWTSQIAFVDRYHLSQKHFLQASATYEFKQNHSAVADGGASTNTQTDASLSPSLLFGYEPDRDILFEISGAWRKLTSEASSANTTNTTKSQSLIMTIAFLHQF